MQPTPLLFGTPYCRALAFTLFVSFRKPGWCTSSKYRGKVLSHYISSSRIEVFFKVGGGLKFLQLVVVLLFHINIDLSSLKELSDGSDLLNLQTFRQ